MDSSAQKTCAVKLKKQNTQPSGQSLNFPQAKTLYGSFVFTARDNYKDPSENPSVISFFNTHWVVTGGCPLVSNKMWENV